MKTHGPCVLFHESPSTFTFSHCGVDGGVGCMRFVGKEKRNGEHDNHLCTLKGALKGRHMDNSKNICSEETFLKRLEGYIYITLGLKARR